MAEKPEPLNPDRKPLFNRDDFDPGAIDERARDMTAEANAARNAKARQSAEMDQAFASARNTASAASLLHQAAFLSLMGSGVYTRDECVKIATDAMQSWLAGLFLMARDRDK